MSGGFEKDASIEIALVNLWKSRPDSPRRRVREHGKKFSRLTGYLADFQREGDKNWRKRYAAFKENGSLPVSGKNIPWDPRERSPYEAIENLPYSQSYSSLYPATIAGIKAWLEQDPAALVAAGDFAESWLTKYYGGKTDSIDWNGRVVADRTLALVFVYSLGCLNGFDFYFMNRLRIAIIHTARLLASDAFHSRKQSSRYSISGVARDLALLIAAVALGTSRKAVAGKARRWPGQTGH
ncbi:MAG: hypothetical protein K2H64_07400 [Desulfovibrio sp.]|nr:hypothetical protein [Desulfovibrio sp.]